MPPKKRSKPENEEEGSDFDEDNEAPAIEPGTSFAEKDGTQGWELGNKRRLTVSEFKGKTYVGIREYYDKNGKLFPGKRGLNLTLEQFRLVVSLKDDVEKLIAEEKS